MTKHDWYRNEKWNDEIESAFFVKLKRAKDKGQYLRIQAAYLTKKHPEIALKLLDEFFSLGDNFDAAQAWVDKADAHKNLDQFELAVKAYKAALERESVYPKLQTQAYLNFPYFVVMNGLKKYYEDCLVILDSHANRLMFPSDFFLWHGSHALILEDKGNLKLAKDHALKAIEYAAKENSGLRHHPNVGIVGDKHHDFKKRLTNLSKTK